MGGVVDILLRREYQGDDPEYLRVLDMLEKGERRGRKAVP